MFVFIDLKMVDALVVITGELVIFLRLNFANIYSNRILNSFPHYFNFNEFLHLHTIKGK